MSFGDDPSVVLAVARDLERLAKHDPALAESSLAATAVVLAEELDRPAGSKGAGSTAKSMCARVLLDTMKTLWELAPEKAKESPLDEIRARRDRKVTGLPTAKDRKRPGRSGAS